MFCVCSFCLARFAVGRACYVCLVSVRGGGVAVSLRFSCFVAVFVVFAFYFRFLMRSFVLTRCFVWCAPPCFLCVSLCCMVLLCVVVSVLLIFRRFWAVFVFAVVLCVFCWFCFFII